MAQKLTKDEVRKALKQLAGWEFDEKLNQLTKSFTFKNFNQAFSFMTSSAMLAEKLDHHPDWQNIYNRVSITLQTHSAAGITQLDIKMATKMNKYAMVFEN